MTNTFVIQLYTFNVSKLSIYLPDDGHMVG